MVALYAVTLFASAALLFLVQPMFARLVLPLLGGSPAVWNTAMVFYQATLLAGYAYAHLSTARLGPRRQAAWHVLFLLLPCALLPIAIPAGWTPPAQGNPAPWLLALMLVAVGLPFFVVSTTSPVLQKWFAASGHPRAADPYFLYAASNVGSLLALLTYPLWLEPRLRLLEQSRLWTWGYALLTALIAACAVALWKTKPHSPPATAPSPVADLPPSEKIAPRRRRRWVLLSFAPSSLMLGVTTYLSSEIAVVPLLWIIPLALYLLTFVLAFARRPVLPRSLLLRALPIIFVALVMVINIQATQPIGWLMLLHLAAFFGHAKIAELLIAHDADVIARSRNANGNTPLHAALAGNHKFVAGLLIGHGADVNAADAQGWRPLHLAAANNNIDAIEALIAQGADVHTPNGEAKTALSIATEKNHREAAALLRRYGA